MDVGKSDFGCKSHAIFKLLFRFGGKAHDDVGCDGAIGIVFSYQFHRVVVLLGRVVAIHRFERCIVTALQ